MTNKVNFALDFLQEFDSVSWYQKELGIVLDYIIELENLVKFFKTLNQESVLDKIKAEIEQLTSRYSISKERGGMGIIEWSDRLIKESDVLQIIDKYKTESEGEE